LSTAKSGASEIPDFARRTGALNPGYGASRGARSYTVSWKLARKGCAG
jgi:hypothetical protein